MAIALACACDSDGSRANDGGMDGGRTGLSSDADACPDGNCPEDCREASRACFAPFVCRQDEASDAGDSDEWTCDIPLDTDVECRGNPNDSLVPFALTTADRPVHWPFNEGCIPVSYEAALASRREDIARAMDAWESVACSELCFAALTQTESAPNIDRRERRIHFTLASDAEEATSTTASFAEETGWILSVLVTFPQDHAQVIDDTALLRIFGQAQGLVFALPAATESIMVSSLAAAREFGRLGADDLDAICKMYGTPSFCAK